MAQNFFILGGKWYTLSFGGSSFDPSKFEVVDGVVKIKAASLADADVAVNAEIQQSKIKGLTTALEAAGAVDTVDGLIPDETTKDIQLTKYLTQAEFDVLAANPSQAQAGIRYMITDGIGTLGLLVPDYARQETTNLVSTSGGSFTVTKDGYIRAYGYTTVADASHLRVRVNNLAVASIPTSGTSISASETAIVVIPVNKGDIVEVLEVIGSSPAANSNCAAYYIPPILRIFNNITASPVNQLLTMGPPNYDHAYNINPLASGAVMPADGYIMGVASAPTNGGIIIINGVAVWGAQTGAGISVFIPVKKGDVMTTSAITTLTVSFYYPVIQPPQYLEGYKIDYSTVEQDTGKRWIDGKTIYQRTILWTSTVVAVGGDVNVTAHNGATKIISDEIVSQSSIAGACQIGISGANFTLGNRGSGALSAGNQWYITVRYTK